MNELVGDLQAALLLALPLLVIGLLTYVSLRPGTWSLVWAGVNAVRHNRIALLLCVFGVLALPLFILSMLLRLGY